ncbi:MAG TPA: hypothetical protein VHN99_02780 [Deinococcales bacterium]|nr:hypothetical protein [Deinococcales bacterium]
MTAAHPLAVPRGSLNRAVLAAGSLPLPAGVAGRLAGDLLSSRALATLVRDAAPREADGLTGPEALRWLTGPAETEARDEFGLVVERFSLALAALVAVLTLAEPAARAARPEWGEEDWAPWRAAGQVVLGGGLVSGGFGEACAASVAGLLAAWGLPGPLVRVAPQPALLPLAGLARRPRSGRAALLDFGQTSVKRGLAEGNTLRVLPSRPSSPPEAGDDLPGWMASLIAETAEACAAGEALVSVAAYLRPDGTLFPGQGGRYGRLNGLEGPPGSWLSARAFRALGRDVRVCLEHDGTAAAAALAGQPGTAVVMLGSALGFGFAPPTERGLNGSARVVGEPANGEEGYLS